MRTSYRSLHTLLLVLICHDVLAQSTAEELARIESETVLLKAREKQLAAKLQLVSREAEISAKIIEANRFGEPGGANDPTVVAIEGIGQNLFATLRLFNGTQLEVRQGETLPNGMRVARILADTVLVDTKNRRRVRLEASVPSPSVTPQNTGSGRQPPFMALPSPPPFRGPAQ